MYVSTDSNWLYQLLFPHIQSDHSHQTDLLLQVRMLKSRHKLQDGSTPENKEQLMYKQNQNMEN